MSAGSARQPTTAPAVKKALQALFTPVLAGIADPADGTVPDPPYYGAPSPGVFGRQIVVLLGWTYADTDWAEISPNKRRTERYAVHASFAVTKPGGTQQEATERVMALWQACDAALTAAPDLVTPLLGSGQQVLWVLSQPKELAEGTSDQSGAARLSVLHVDFAVYARI